MRGGREGGTGTDTCVGQSYCQIPARPFYLGKAKGLSFSSKVFGNIVVEFRFAVPFIL